MGRSQLPFLHLERYAAEIIRFLSQDGEDSRHVPGHLLREGRGTGLLLEEIKARFGLPEDPEGGEFEQVGQIVPGRFDDLLDLEARIDRIDDRTEDIQILKDQPHRFSYESSEKKFFAL
jgi:hypothetical protein